MVVPVRRGALRVLLSFRSCPIASLDSLRQFTDTYDALHTQRILVELNRTDNVSTTAFTEVPTVTLASLLAHPPTRLDHVDVLSVDTENSELAVLQGLDFDAVTVDIVVVRETGRGVGGGVS